MVRLSVNINKVATIRNARGGNTPDLVNFAIDCEKYGAEGITVHPRPDERHIKYSDVMALKPVLTTEFNIEGYPSKEFMDLVTMIRPTQVTLVPDPPDVLTSNAGWDTISNQSFLRDTIQQLKSAGIRSSLFLGPDQSLIDSAAETGTDRIELYTESYANSFDSDQEASIHLYKKTASLAHMAGLGINAGHDLNLKNLKFFVTEIPELTEVSIGHALICDALYFGIENTIQMYRRCLKSN